MPRIKTPYELAVERFIQQGTVDGAAEQLWRTKSGPASQKLTEYEKYKQAGGQGLSSQASAQLSNKNFYTAGTIKEYNPEHTFRSFLDQQAFLRKFRDEGVWDVEGNAPSAWSGTFLAAQIPALLKQYQDSQAADEDWATGSAMAEYEKMAKNAERWKQLYAEKDRGYSGETMDDGKPNTTNMPVEEAARWQNWLMADYLLGDQKELFDFDAINSRYEAMSDEEYYAEEARLQKQFDELDWEALMNPQMPVYESKTAELEKKYNDAVKEQEARKLWDSYKGLAEQTPGTLDLEKYYAENIKGYDPQVFSSDRMANLVYFINHQGGSGQQFDVESMMQGAGLGALFTDEEQRTVQSYYDKGYNYLLPDEIVVYNDLYHTDPKIAQGFLDSLEGELSKRRYMVKNAETEVLATSKELSVPMWMIGRVAGIADALMAPVKAAEALSGDDNYYGHTNDFGNMQQMVNAAQEAGLGEVEWANNLGTIGGKNILQHLYTGGTSAADNTLRIGAGGKFGALALAGLGSASSTLQELSMRDDMSGAAKVVQAGLIGGLEVVTEKIGLDNLFKVDVPSASKYLINSMGAEIGEEVVNAIGQEGVEYVVALIFGHEAEIKSAGERGTDLLNTIVQTAISSLLMGGGGAISQDMSTRATGKQLQREGDIEGVLKIAESMPAESASAQAAAPIRDMQKRGKKVSTRSLGKLVNAVAKDIGDENAATVNRIYEEAIEDRLVELGEDAASAKNLAPTIRKVSRGERIPMHERAAIAWTDNASQVVKELATETREGEENRAGQSWKAQTQGRLTEAAVGTMGKTAQFREAMTSKTSNVTAAGKAAERAKALTKGNKGKNKLQAKELAYDDGTKGQGEFRKVIKDGETLRVGISVDGSDHLKEVDVDSLTGAGDEGLATILEYATYESRHEMSAEEINIMAGTYAQQGGDAGEFIQQFEDSYLAGYSGVEQKPSSKLMQIAYEHGRYEAVKDEKNRVARAKEARSNAAPTVGWLGDVASDADVKGSGDAKALDEATKGMTEGQQLVVEFAKNLSRNTGLNFVMFRSKAMDGGSISTQNGSYNAATNTIYLDVNAGVNNAAELARQKEEGTLGYAIMRTLGHEVTHAIEATSVDFYDQYKQEVKEELTAAGKDWAQLVRQKLDAAMRAGQKLTYAGAEAEVVADASEYMLQDSQFVQNMDAGLKNKVKRIMQDFIGKIRAAFKALTGGHEESMALRTMKNGVMQYSERLQKLWDAGFMEMATAKVGGIKDGVADTLYKTGEIYSYTTQNSLRVRDKETIAYLENQQHITTYRAMQVIDGKLYPPMAEFIGSKKDGNREDPGTIGSWEMAAEHPELIKWVDGKPKFELKKTNDDGSVSTVPAAYNPYMHSSNTVLNDQFSKAFQRENLVVVECVVPVSESDGAYRAQYAKDATGWHEWKSGVVAGDLAKQKKGFRRDVFLSRYIKPVRILPDAEVAEKIAGYLEGTDVTVPFQCAWPSLREALVQAGVSITEPRALGPSQMKIAMEAYEEWKNHIGEAAEMVEEGRNVQNQNRDVEYAYATEEDFHRDGMIYNYDFLIKQKAASVVVIPSVDTLMKKGTFSRADIVEQGKANIPGLANESGHKKVENEYTGRTLTITNTSIRHGLNGEKHRLLANAQIGLVIGEVVKNGIPINGLETTDKNALQTYAMVTPCITEDGKSMMAVTHVDIQKNEVNSVTFSDIVHSANGRIYKNSEPVSNTIDVEGEGPDHPSRYTISIADLLRDVNKSFKSLLSKDVLAHLGEERPANGLYTNKVLYSRRDTTEQTETDAFKRWFGNSKVVNWDGTPKVMYHGTPYGGFTVFKGWQYFTDNKEYADKYHNPSASSIRGRYNPATNPQTYEVYLSVKKPFDTRNPKIRKIWRNKFNGSYSGTPLSDRGLPDWTDGIDLIDFIEENDYDYDAIILDEGGVGGYGDEVQDRGISVVVRSSNQVKSATDNVGTFDPQNPDIRYSRRDEEPSEDPVRQYEIRDTKSATVREFIAEAGDAAASTVEEKNALAIYRKRLDEYAETVKETDAAEQTWKEAKTRFGEFSEQAVQEKNRLSIKRMKQKAAYNKLIAVEETPHVAQVMDVVQQFAAEALSGTPEDIAQRQREAIALLVELEDQYKALKAAGRTQMATEKKRNVEMQRRYAKLFENRVAKGIVKEKAEYREREQKAREYRHSREELDKLRRRIGRNVKRLNTMRMRETDQRHVPQEFHHLADAVMQTFTDSSLAKLAFSAEKTASLARRYRLLQGVESDTTYFWDDEIEGEIENLVALSEAYNAIRERGAGVPSYFSLEGVKMETEILTGVDNIVSNVLQMIDSANDAFLLNRTETFNAYATKTGEEIRKKQDYKQLKGWLGKAQKMLDENIRTGNMTPIYFMEHLNSPLLKEVFDEVRMGQSDYAKIIAQGKDFVQDAKEKYHYGAWVADGKLKMKTSQGHQIELTREEAAELYAIAKRESTNKLYQTEHLLYGGFQYKDITKKGEGLYAAKKESHQLDAADIDKISRWLTDEQKAYADTLVGFLSTTMAEYGNAASMEMYGYKKFNETYYIPFHTAAEQRFQRGDEGPQGENAGTGRLKNSSFTHRLQHGANETLVVGGLTDTVSEHIHKMATYAAMVQPIENMKRLLNHKVMEPDGTVNTIRALIGQKYGQASQDYMTQLLKDLNGAAMGDERATDLVNSMIGAFKRGAVMASASVVLQQPTAMARAMAYISPKYFTQNPFYRPGKGTWDEMMKYAGTAVIKDMGKFDVGMGLTARQYIADETLPLVETFRALKTGRKTGKDAFDRVVEFITAAPGKADQWTWGLIWKAVKAEQAEQHPGMDVNSEEFLRLCGDRFDDVIDHTQVYDSVITRSNLMRSKNTLHRMATSFMSEPTLSINMLYDAFLGKHDKKQRGKILGGVIVSQVLAGAMAALAQAWNDDEDKRNVVERYADRATANILDNLNPLGMLPYVSDLMSLFAGYEVERPDMAAIADIIDYGKTFITKAADPDKELTWKDYENFVGTIANMAGLPAKNISREMRRTRNLIVNSQWTAPDAFSVGQAMLENVPFYQSKNAVYYERIVAAELNGDTQKAQDYREYMLLSKMVSEDAMKTGLKKAMQERFISGDADEDAAKQYLLKIGAYADEDDAYWEVDKWKEMRDEGIAAGDYRKYADFFQAVETGENLRATIKEYLDNGVSKTTLASQITTQYKQQLIDLKASGKGYADLQARLLTAYEVLGYDRAQKQKDIQKWFEKK